RQIQDIQITIYIHGKQFVFYNEGSSKPVILGSIECPCNGWGINIIGILVDISGVESNKAVVLACAAYNNESIRRDNRRGIEKQISITGCGIAPELLAIFQVDGIYIWTIGQIRRII